MSRTRGSVLAVELADGTRQYRLRFLAGGARQSIYVHERRDCPCGCGGGFTERTARRELDNVLARIRAGVWQPPTPPETDPHPGQTPTFHEYASRWLAAKRDGSIGERPISLATHADLLWQLKRHLLPYFGRHRLDEIDRRACLAFKQHVIHQAAQTREALDAGADLRDHRGRRQVPLGPASLRKLLRTLRAVLDEAVEDEYLTANPARSNRLRVHVPKPTRTFLELDELAALEEAARRQDPDHQTPELLAAAERNDSAGQVAQLVLEGQRPARIARDLGLCRSTVAFHLERLGCPRANDYLGRHAIVSTLGRSGIRVGELCALRIGHLRLDDASPRFRVEDAKTEAGIREVQVTPQLATTLAAHLDRLRRAGHPTGPVAPVFPNRRGGHLTRQRVSGLLREAAEHASREAKRVGKPPLPNTTPHTLRRTYISIALLANNFDVLWVMHQVGHADSKMTIDVYAQLQQRHRHEQGSSFDRLLDSTAIGRAGDPTSGPCGGMTQLTGSC